MPPHTDDGQIASWITHGSASSPAHRRTTSSAASSTLSALPSLSSTSSTSQNARNDRIQARMRGLATSNELDGGGKSLGARTKVIKRGRTDERPGSTTGPPPTFRGGVVGDLIEVVDPLSANKRPRLTAPPRWIDDSDETEPHLELVRLPTPCGSSRTRVQIRNSRVSPSHVSDRQFSHGHVTSRTTSPSPDWLASILADNPSPPPSEPWPRKAASSAFVESDSASSTRTPRSRAVPLPPSPYSLPADLHDSTPLGGSAPPPRPFFEAQLARAPSTPAKTIWEESTPMPPELDLHQPPHGFFMPPPSASRLSHPHSSRQLTPANSMTPARASPFGSFGELYHELNHEIVSSTVGRDVTYEPQLRSSSSTGSYQAPTIFSSESDLENRAIEDFWKRPNVNDRDLSQTRHHSGRPSHLSTNDRYAASLAQAACEQFTSVVPPPSIGQVGHPTPISRQPLAARSETLEPKSQNHASSPVQNLEHLFTPSPPNRPRMYETPPPLPAPALDKSSLVVERIEPPAADLHVRASSAPPILVHGGESLDAAGEIDEDEQLGGPQRVEEQKDVAGDENEEMHNLSDGASTGERSTDGDSIFPPTTTTTFTGLARTDWTSEIDDDDELLQDMLGQDAIFEASEERWSIWEDPPSEL